MIPGGGFFYMLQEASSRCCSFVDGVWLLCRTAAGRCGSADLHNCITLLDSDLPVGVCFALGVADG